MKAFFLFAPRFLEWPIAVCRRLEGEYPNLEVCGLSTGGRRVQETARRELALPDGRVDSLVELEADWLSNRVSDQVRERVHAHFSAADLNRIIISDRNVGAGYVTGGLQPRTELSDLCSDSEYVDRYIYHPCDWVIAKHREQGFEFIFLYAVAGAPATALSLYCRNKGLRIMRLVHSRLGQQMLLDTSPVGLFDRVWEHDPNHIGEESKVEANQYLTAVRERDEQPDYYRIHGDAALRSAKLSYFFRNDFPRLLRNFTLVRKSRTPEYKRKPSKREQARFDLRVSLGKRHLVQRWPYNAPEERGRARFAYYPLHVDPEASTMVLAPMPTNQLQVIEALSKSLPPDMKLVVKEHLPMLGRRPAGFYDAITRLPNTLLLSPLEDSLPLVRKAELVTVITGTAAWEAMVLGRPALVLGDMPYARLGEGVMQCDNLAKLPEVIPEALKMAPASDERLTDFLARLYELSFEFPSDLLWGDVDPSTVEAQGEILDNIVASMRQILDYQTHGPA